MDTRFTSFVIFAEMRTGSNFLESNLDLFPNLHCFGEAFNPYFMVSPSTKELFGFSVKQRDENPDALLAQIKSNTKGLAGFRFFHDHDPRMFDTLMDDPQCAKIVLTRNIVDSYVSRRIAMETDQWQLSQSKDAVKKKARFIPDEFEKLFYRIKNFQIKIKDRLQRSGQTAFYIDYEDIQNLEVVNGLARFLGETTEITEFSRAYKKQNPEPLSDKVSRFELLSSTVSRLDVFDLHKLPNFEPSRPPALKTYVISHATGLIFMPIPGGVSTQMTNWMTQQGPVTQETSQKELRQWKRNNKNHRSFTILRHPVARLYAAFCPLVAWQDEDPNWELKHALRQSYDIALPERTDQEWDLASHHTAFVKFINFIGKTLQGQTGFQIDPIWATQTETVKGFASFALPDHLLREDQLDEGFPNLLAELGQYALSALNCDVLGKPFELKEIYTPDIEMSVRKIYQKDYMMFGFRPWAAG